MAGLIGISLAVLVRIALAGLIRISLASLIGLPLAVLVRISLASLIGVPLAVLVRISLAIRIRIALAILIRVALTTLRITPATLLRITLAAARDFLHRRSASHITQDRLDARELICVVNRICNAQCVSFAVYVLKSIPRIRMIAQPLRTAATTLLFQRPKHICKIVRIVSRIRHYVRAEYVGLFLIIPAELQKRRADAQLTSLGDSNAAGAAEYCAKDLPRYHPGLILSSLRGLSRSVTQSNVADLMRHRANQFAFVVRSLNQTAIHKGEAARQSERVQVAHIYHLERVSKLRMLELGGNCLDESLTDVFDVSPNLAILEKRHLAFDLARSLLANLDVFIKAVWVAGSHNFGLAQNLAQDTDR